ncbi:hypothetical protein [Streptacidiphilus fuscans]|uniref:Secreted protein n=1 Tax=Streptacidiphilus fuscans TaxID=2789292 RepID=A0A931BAF8_9ACTN|nr:hypothetical protein [Streptacidiphilus fuscans]MBF9072001.1 hypothetical protein [Streptacidiphilus fuscans]
MNRRIATLLVGGMLSLAGLAAAPTTALADSGAYPQAQQGDQTEQTQKYVCNVNDSDATTVVQTNDIAAASDTLPALLPMQLSNCRPAS